MNLTALGRKRAGCLLFLIAFASGMKPLVLQAAPDASAVASAANGDDTSNPYAVITERNIFHLSPPPPPPEPEKPKVELPVVKITGFVNIGNVSRVLFVSLPKDKREEPTYYSLAEGEKGSDGTHQFELVRIHPLQDAVDVINDGTPVTLTVKDDTLGPTAAPAAAPDENQRERPGRGNGMPGRPMFPGRNVMPGMPGIPGGNGFPAFPNRPRRNVPQPSQ
jgi:hypothetical protein